MEAQIMIDYGKIIQQALEMIVTLLLPVVLGYVVVWLRAKTEEVKSKISKEQLSFLEETVRRFVMAAEQAGFVDDAKNIGVEKKKFVINLVESELAKRGINVDLDVIDAMVEAEVYESLTLFKKDAELIQK